MKQNYAGSFYIEGKKQYYTIVKRTLINNDQYECIIKYTDTKNNSISITKQANKIELSIVDPIKAKQYYEELAKS